MRDATHVLDGLLYHESDLHIEEHYTDTTGFTDHVFACVICWGSGLLPASATLLTRAFMPWRSYPAIRRSRRSSAGP